jgi:hypothetical protein
MRRGYVAIYSGAGRMVAFSDNQKLLRKVAAELATTLPSTPSNDPAFGITEARRVALRRIAGGEGNEE